MKPTKAGRITVSNKRTPPAGNRGLTNASTKEMTMAVTQHTRATRKTPHLPAPETNLAASIWSHRSDRPIAEVLKEIELAKAGWSIERLLERRESRG